MHLIVPFAAPLSEAGLAATRTLVLPSLHALLQRLAQVQRDEGDEFSLNPPHEKALAAAWGWQAEDGALPWAAWHAAADGVAVGQHAWGEVTPAHWHLGTDQVSLLDPAALVLDEAASRECLLALEGLFTSEGFTLVYGAPLRWYLAHPSLAGLRCASLDRVVGRNVDRWLTDDPALRQVRRLQSEVQMQMYTHPLNQRREARGLLPVNSFWLSGCGVAQPAAAAPVVVDDRLRGPALAEDWAAWAKAWEALDEGPLAALLALPTPVQLTLCGERASVRFETAERSLWQRVSATWQRPHAAAVLERL